MRRQMSKLRNSNLNEKREKKKILREIKRLKSEMESRQKAELEACIAQKEKDGEDAMQDSREKQ